VTIVAWKEAKEHATLTSTAGGRREWSAPYLLTSDNPRDDGQTCVDFMDTIGRGLSDTFRYADREDSTVWCKKVTPTRIPNSVLHWQVVCEYSPLEPKESSEDEDGNPTDDPMDWRYEISCGTQFFQTPVWKAWNIDPMPHEGVGAGYQCPAETLGPVVNSAGIVYDPPLLRDTPETVLRISGNWPEYWAANLTCYAGRINPSPLRWSVRLLTYYGFRDQVFPPYCVLCAAVTADYRRDNGVSFWQYTYEWRIRERASTINPQDGFLETILDRGITRLAKGGSPDGKGGTISASDIKEGMGINSPVRDVAGDRVPELVLFDGHGQPLQAADSKSSPPVYFRWRVHPYAEFQVLPLDIFR
jgi:hypothetical protein